MLNLNSVMIGSQHPKVLAEFYEKIFGKKADMVDGDWHGWQCGAGFFSVGPHDKVTGTTKEPDRILMNFETKEVKSEFERIKATGAAVVKEPYQADPSHEDFWIATFADPDGNLFQLMSPWQ